MATLVQEAGDKAGEDLFLAREMANPGVHESMERVRAEFKLRGAKNIAKLGKKFRIIDDSGDGNLDQAEFQKCMIEQRLDLTPEQIDALFMHFDEDKSGSITYDEFLVALRGKLNERREQMVLLAFDVIDKDKSGILDLDDITEAYDASKHPDVIAGKRTKQEILREFLDVFDGGEKDGQVFPNEFMRYYSNVSAYIDDDDYFELMIRNAWHIPGGEGWCANTANKRVLVTDADGNQRVECIQNDLGLDTNDPKAVQAQLDAQGSKGAYTPPSPSGPQKNKNPTAKLGGGSLGSAASLNGGGGAAAAEEPSKRRTPKSRLGESSISIFGSGVEYGPATDLTPEEESMGWSKDMPESTRGLLRRLKQSLRRRGTMGIAKLGKKFRIIDDDGSGTLDLAEFTKCLTEHRLGFDEAQIAEMFAYFDADGSQSITYDEFLVGIRGELSERRAQMVLMAFDVLDADKSGEVTIDDIRMKYDAKSSPEVKQGKETEDEVLAEFLDVFDQGDKDGKVTPDEFSRYYSNVSASIDEDDYFELMIRNAWHIPGGEGWCANTANKRVLVTHPDGRQTVECIHDDLGVDLSDPEVLKAKLASQGVDASKVDTVGKVEEPSKAKPVSNKAKHGKVASPAAAAAPRKKPNPAFQKTSLW
uniref:EF-hand domain-containing protein n=1 Tax=Rhizochromulina marina TaxID=1034831 RepID=A0A6U0WUQ8_9STRA